MPDDVRWKPGSIAEVGPGPARTQPWKIKSWATSEAEERQVQCGEGGGVFERASSISPLQHRNLILKNTSFCCVRPRFPRDSLGLGTSSCKSQLRHSVSAIYLILKPLSSESFFVGLCSWFAVRISFPTLPMPCAYLSIQNRPGEGESDQL